MATNSRERHPRAASRNSTRPGGYRAASTLPEPETGINTTPVAAQSGIVATPITTTQSSKKGAKGQGKAVDSNVDPGDDEEGRVAPSNRLELARQELLKNNTRFRQQVQSEEAERDLQALLQVAGSGDESDTETGTATRPAKELAKTAPTANKPPAANKPSTANKPLTSNKPGPTSSRSTKSATIQNGSITKAIKAKKQQPEKRKRKPRKVDYGYESIPDDSDDGAKHRDTVAKLRETIDRHARWCPFVRINKKLHRVHRRTKRLEMSDSEDSDGNSELGEDSDDKISDSEGNQSDAESDGGEDTQPSKMKQSKQTTGKTAAKDAALKKRAAPLKPPPPKAASGKKGRSEVSGLSKVQDEASGIAGANDQSEFDASEKDRSGNEHGVDTTAEAHVSDDELSSRSDDEVEQLQEAHEREQMFMGKEATDPSSGNDTSSQKCKLADHGLGPGEKETATKKRRSA